MVFMHGTSFAVEVEETFFRICLSYAYEPFKNNHDRNMTVIATQKQFFRVLDVKVMYNSLPYLDIH